MITRFVGPHHFLSNFAAVDIRAPFDNGNRVYRTVEHAYQAMKTLDAPTRDLIAAMTSPVDAKRAGRNIELRPDWHSEKRSIMALLVWLKFQQEPFRQQLLDTGDQQLVEGNYWGDRYWGQCPIGTGDNVLGKILMDTRARLRLQTLGEGWQSV